MTRSRTFYPRLAQALPSRDPLAKLAARALVLYSDLLFEWPGMGTEEGFDGLSKLGILHRQLYFFRASCVTLQACRLLLDQLMALSSFRAMLAKDPTSASNFIMAKKEFNSHSELIARLRNEIGGHIEEHIGDAIARFEPDDVGKIELHDQDVLRPHLATDILISAILKDCPKGQEDEEFKRILIDINEATRAMISVLADFLAMYGTSYPLFPGR